MSVELPPIGPPPDSWSPALNSRDKPDISAPTIQIII